MLIVVEFKELSALRCFECLADGCFATARDLLDVRCVTRETTCPSAKRLVLGVYTTVRTDSCEETFSFFCWSVPAVPVFTPGSLEESSRYFARTSSHTLYTGSHRI